MTQTFCHVITIYISTGSVFVCLQELHVLHGSGPLFLFSQCKCRSQMTQICT